MIEGTRSASELLFEARSVLVLTGAGISAESGVPTFRDAGGLWGEFRAEDLATPEAFERDPRTVWEWYGWRREQLAACRPNAAHLALAGRQVSRPGGLRIATQNVDGLHALAAAEVSGEGTGTSAPDLVEVHGALFRSRCTVCHERVDGRHAVDSSSVETLPRCECGGLLRPDVVWFGESLDPHIIGTAFEWAAASDVCLVIGTSALVHPAASLPIATRERGGAIVELNPEETPLTALASVSIRGRAAEVVPTILSGDES